MTIGSVNLRKEKNGKTYYFDHIGGMVDISFISGFLSHSNHIFF